MKNKFESLFPLKGEVTKEIIEIADVGSPTGCPGALTFNAALKKNIILLEQEHSSWGIKRGINYVTRPNSSDPIRYIISTEENVNFMEVKQPQKVTFIILEHNRIPLNPVSRKGPQGRKKYTK